jgi:hypothetical protein
MVVIPCNTWERGCQLNGVLHEKRVDWVLPCNTWKELEAIAHYALDVILHITSESSETRVKITVSYTESEWSNVEAVYQGKFALHDDDYRHNYARAL